jgi:hypothetical protein
VRDSRPGTSNFGAVLSFTAAGSLYGVWHRGFSLVIFSKRHLQCYDVRVELRQYIKSPSWVFFQ